MKSVSQLLLTVLVSLSAISAAWATDNMHIYGRSEQGLLVNEDVKLDVKMDTGALTASLSAHDIELFETDGDDWVRFAIDPTHIGEDVVLEYPLKRIVRIKKRAGEIQSEEEASFERRPVIEMALCLGDDIELIEVSLADRSNFIYPMLLGRSGMEQFGVLIDPAALYTTQPVCRVDTPADADEE